MTTTYKKMLKKVISESKMKVSDIAKKCSDMGTPVTSAYIYMIMKNGKPPKDDISRAICRACNANEDLLVITAYLENAPKKVRTLLSAIYTIGLKQAEQITNIDCEELMKEITLPEIISELSDDASEFINEIDTEFHNQGIELFNSTGDSITLKDKGMYPRLPLTFKCNIDVEEVYNNGDVLLFSYNTEETDLYARIYKRIDGIDLLVPMNSEFDPIVYDRRSISIRGRISKVTMNM